jgi:hypothetical protein
MREGSSREYPVFRKICHQLMGEFSTKASAHETPVDYRGYQALCSDHPKSF